MCAACGGAFIVSHTLWTLEQISAMNYMQLLSLLETNLCLLLHLGRNWTDTGPPSYYYTCADRHGLGTFWPKQRKAAGTQQPDHVLTAQESYTQSCPDAYSLFSCTMPSAVVHAPRASWCRPDLQMTEGEMTRSSFTKAFYLCRPHPEVNNCSMKTCFRDGAERQQ